MLAGGTCFLRKGCEGNERVLAATCMCTAVRRNRHPDHGKNNSCPTADSEVAEVAQHHNLHGIWILLRYAAPGGFAIHFFILSASRDQRRETFLDVPDGRQPGGATKKRLTESGVGSNRRRFDQYGRTYTGTRGGTTIVPWVW